MHINTCNPSLSNCQQYLCGRGYITIFIIPRSCPNPQGKKLIVCFIQPLTFQNCLTYRLFSGTTESRSHAIALYTAFFRLRCNITVPASLTGKTPPKRYEQTCYQQRITGKQKQKPVLLLANTFVHFFFNNQVPPTSVASKINKFTLYAGGLPATALCQSQK